MACRTWLWWQCRPHRGLTWRGVRVEVCRHTDWRGHGRSIPPELPQPACLDKMTWPSGRMLRTSDPWGRMRLYGLCKMGSWGALACRGGHRSRWYRRLWPCRGKLRRWASFCRNSGYSFNEAGQLQGCAMSGSEPKLLVSHQSVFVYYM